MTLKDAEKIKVGAIVRESWSTHDTARHGLVLLKEYEEAHKYEHILCQHRDERYVLTVQWLSGTLYPSNAPTRERRSSWDLMVVSHVE